MQDVNARVRTATDKRATGAEQYTYVVVRDVGGDTEYRVQVRLRPNGTVDVRLMRAIDNQETTLGSIVTVPGVMHTANISLAARRGDRRQPGTQKRVLPVAVRNGAGSRWAAYAGDPVIHKARGEEVVLPPHPHAQQPHTL